MKKITTLLLVIVICFTLFGCGDSNTLPNETTTAESTTPGVNQTTTSVVIASTDQSTAITAETTTAQTTTPGTYDENDTSAEHFKFTLKDDDTYSVKAGENLPEEAVIPSTYEGKSVTAIEDDAFFGCGIISITIPDSVTSIGDTAFCWSYSLKSVTFGENSQLTTIGDSAFNYCTSLESITIPDSVTSIGAAAFRDCASLASITIPNSVTSIGANAFRSCASLITITFDGTIEQWDSITKDSFMWNAGVPATTVTCSDGTVTLN